MTDTRHLDTAIAIFKGSPASKRAPMSFDVVVVQTGQEKFNVQYRGRLLLPDFDIVGKEAAIEEAKTRAVRLTKLTGKKHTVVDQT